VKFYSRTAFMLVGPQNSFFDMKLKCQICDSYVYAQLSFIFSVMW